jgi:hypothetical protein
MFENVRSARKQVFHPCFFRHLWGSCHAAVCGLFNFKPGKNDYYDLKLRHESCCILPVLHVLFYLLFNFFGLESRKGSPALVLV